MSNQVAKTIIAQLGGGAFAAMTGAKDFVFTDNSVTFKIGRNAKSINRVTVKLNGNDLYDIAFQKHSFSNKTFEHKCVTKAEHTDIYSDMLREIFTQETGMYTSLRG